MSLSNEEIQAMQGALLLSIDGTLKEAHAPKEPELSTRQKANIQLGDMMSKKTPGQVKLESQLNEAFAAKNK